MMHRYWNAVRPQRFKYQFGTGSYDPHDRHEKCMSEQCVSLHGMHKEHNEAPLLYDVNDACRLLGLSRSSLYEEIGRQRLRSIKCGQRRLVPREALFAWIDDRQAEAAR